MTYVDTVEAVKYILADLADQVVTVTPAVFPGRIIQVARIGGSDDDHTDRPRIRITVWDPLYRDARDTANECRDRLRRGRWSTPHGVIDRATTEVGPREVETPGGQENTRRFDSVFRVSARRRT